MSLVVALSAVIVGMLLAIVPAMFIHDDPDTEIVDAYSESDVDGRNLA